MPDISAAILSASALTVRYGIQTVLDSATVTIGERERVGLVGRNGCGKSTFLRIAAGVLQPDAGEITRRRDLVTGYLPQQWELDLDQTVHANVLAGAQHVLDFIEEYETTPPEGNRAGELLEKIDHADGWNLEHRTKSLLTNLHAPDPDRLVRDLSGGEKRRVALCRALLGQPELLILDEPTNHLDTEAIEWLERFLAEYPGACLFVTHDRYFLDRVVTRIVELARGQFLSYEGTYADFLLAKADRQVGEELGEKRRRKFLRQELEWVRKGPSARRTKSVDRIARYHEMAAQEGPEAELDIEMIIPPAPKLANRVIEMKKLRFELGDRVLIDSLTLDIPAPVRIGIVGRNGLGKTTLMRLMLGEIQPTSGTVEIGARTAINYIDQNRLVLNEDKTIYDEVGEGLEYVRLGDENVSLRGYLRRFLFTDERINQRISLLSGGERSRVILAKILKRGGNVLMLDEPTNDLDLATLRLMEEALVLFKGTVIVVSHDRYFLNRICTHILAFEGDGKTFYDAGNYDDYRAKLLIRQAVPVKAAPAPIATPAPPAANKGRKLTWKETKELEGMEETILGAETEVKRLEALAATPELYKEHAAIAVQMDAARKRVAELYLRWELLGAT